MGEVKVIEIKQNVLKNNEVEADRLRADLKAENIFLLNLMSAPGSGKTSCVLHIIEKLKDEMNIGVMEADIDSSVDAQ